MVVISVSEGPPKDTWQKKPLTWRGLRYKDGHRGASLSCVNGHSGTLTDHNIAADGIVTPSVVCPEDKCGWHVMVVLEGWDPDPQSDCLSCNEEGEPCIDHVRF